MDRWIFLIIYFTSFTRPLEQITKKSQVFLYVGISSLVNISVECGQGQYLVDFELTSAIDLISDQFILTCATLTYSPATFSIHTTSPTSYTNENTFEYLDKHLVECPYNGLLKRVVLQKSSDPCILFLLTTLDAFYYNYTCISPPPSYNCSSEDLPIKSENYCTPLAISSSSLSTYKISPTQSNSAAPYALQSFQMVTNICNVLLNQPPSYFYYKIKYCTICGEQCDSCLLTNGQICKQCSIGRGYHCTQLDANNECIQGLCLTAPPVGFFLESLRSLAFTQCYELCAECLVNGDANYNNCVRCKSGYAFYPNDPYNNCYYISSEIIRYYFNSTENPTTFIPCDQSCYTCNTGNACITCTEEYYFIDGIISICYSYLDGYYLDTTSLVYKPCFDTCLTCSGPIALDSHNCLTCKDGFILDNSQNCLTSCSVGQYYSINGGCLSCIGNCEVCNDGISCYKCMANYYLVPSKISCVDTCPIGTFNDSSSAVSVCSTCEYPCTACVSKSSCLQCASGYYLYGETCQLCQQTCLTCIAAQICTSCIKGFYFDGLSCVHCNQLCSACSSASLCQECISGYFLYKGNCIDYCPDGTYYSNLVNSCVPCATVCSRCKDDSNYCIQCSASAFAFPLANPIQGMQYSCGSTCPANYYSDEMKTCKTCTQIGHVFMNNICVKTCDAGYYSDSSGTCVKCEKVILDNGCIDSCPLNYILNVETRVCYYSNSPQINCQKNNPCQNGGECYEETGVLKCRCGIEYTGSNCEGRASIDQSVKLLGGPVNETISFLNNFQDLLQRNSTELTKEMKDAVITYADNQISKALSGQIPITSDILKVSDLALSLQVDAQKNIHPTSASTFQKKVNETKAAASALVDMLITSSDLNVSRTIVNDFIKVQYLTTTQENLNEMADIARKNNISILTFTKCEEKIKEYFNLPQNMSLIIKKIDYSASLNFNSGPNSDASSGVTFQFYHPITKERLDHTEACKDEAVTISIPLKATQKNETLQLYLNMSSHNIDIFDPNSTAFTTRCFIMNDTSGADMSINSRIKNLYQNKTATCGKNCKYEGIDVYGYVKCSCTNTQPNSEMSSELVEAILDNVPNINLDIIICYKEAFVYPETFFNPGFYIISAFTLIGCLDVLIFSSDWFSNWLIRTSLNSIIKNDALLYDSSTMTKSEYFDQFAWTNEQNKDFPNAEKAMEMIQKNIPETKKPEHVHHRSNSGHISYEGSSRALVPIQVGNPKQSMQNNKSSSDNLGISIDATQREKQTSLILSNIPTVNAVNYCLFKGNELNHPNMDILEIKRKETMGVSFSHCEMSYGKPARNEWGKSARIHSTQKKSFPTLKDLEELTLSEMLFYDKRPWHILLFDFVLEENLIIWLIFKKSLLEPLWYRLLFFCFNMCVIFTVNALLFSDDYIQERAAVSAEERDSIKYVFLAEMAKTILSLVITAMVTFLFSLVGNPTSKMEENLNEALKSQNIHTIIEGFQNYNQMMKWRFISVILVVIIVHGFCLYYASVFCAIYMASRKGWIYGAVMGLILDWCGISLAVSCLRVVIRILSRKYPKMKIIVRLEYFLWLKNFLG